MYLLVILLVSADHSLNPKSEGNDGLTRSNLIVNRSEFAFWIESLWIVNLFAVFPKIHSPTRNPRTDSQMWLVDRNVAPESRPTEQCIRSMWCLWGRQKQVWAVTTLCLWWRKLHLLTQLWHTVKMRNYTWSVNLSTSQVANRIKSKRLLVT